MRVIVSMIVKETVKWVVHGFSFVSLVPGSDAGRGKDHSVCDG